MSDVTAGSSAMSPAADPVEQEDPTPIGGTAGIYNSAVATFAIAAAWELGALDELREWGSLDAREFAARNDLHLPATAGMFAAIAAVGVVTRSGSLIRPGPAFDEVYRDKAFFHWFAMGCAELFAAMPTVMRNPNRVGKFYRRNSSAIAMACRDINRLSFDAVFWQAMEGLDFDLQLVADLGCGSGGRLVQIAERYPGARGIGIDVSAEALRDATAYAQSVGYGDRLQFVSGDITGLDHDARFEEVELLTCFMTGHDLWPREEAVASLRRMRETFPNARRFLLGDTARSVGIPDTRKPVFTLGFELAHDLMGDYLPTLAEWEDALDASGWKCVNIWRADVPSHSVVYELA